MQAPLILPMHRADLPAVCRIADVAFPVPWRREDFERELVRAWAVIRVLRPHSGAPIAAFVHYWWVSGEIQIMNVATDPALRRRGHARALLNDVLHAAAGRARSLILEVRRGNRAAIALYERLGFQGVGLRPRYYADDGEDALVMRRELLTAATAVDRIARGC
jgi:ribosomal-protein-alanine N-acetyltransferase